MTKEELLEDFTEELKTLLDSGDPDLDFKLETLTLALCTDLYDHGITPFKLAVRIALSHAENAEGHHVIQLLINPRNQETKKWLMENAQELKF